MPPPPPGTSAGAALSDLSQAVEELSRAVKDGLGPSLADTTIKITALGVVLSKLGAVENVIKPLVRNVSETFRRLADVESWLKPLTQRFGKVFERQIPDWAVGFEAALSKPWWQKAFDAVASGLGAASERLLKPVTRMLVPLSQAAGAVAAVSAAAPVAAGAVAALASVMSGFVAKANPALVEQFTFAMNDLQAVIGQGLAPVFKIFSDLVRTFADTLATFMPELGAAVATVLKPLADTLKILFEVFGNVAQVAARVLEAVAPALAALGEAFNAVLRAVLPVVNLVVDVFGSVLVGVMKAFAAVVKTVVPPIVAFMEIIGDMVAWVIRQVRNLLEFFGLLDPETPGTEKGKSFGASARAANTGSVESMLQKARESAFTLGNAAAEDPKLAIGKGLLGEVKSIREAIERVPDRIGQVILRATGLGKDFDSPEYMADRDREIAATIAFADRLAARKAGDPAAEAKAAMQHWLLRSGLIMPDGSGTVPRGGP